MRSIVPFRGYKVWHRVVGDHESPGKPPRLCLHGGRGASHDYLEPLEAMAPTGRRVIFYDQLGAGNSDHPHNPSLWSVPLFVEELGVMCQALGFTRVHILGQSWGGMLGMEYALAQLPGLASLIIVDSPVSMPQWVAEAYRLRAELPSDIQETLLKHELNGTTNNPAYQGAVLVFYHRHLCRLDPWSDCLNRAFEKLAKDPEVYNTMNGSSEFHVIGVIKDWDIVDRLGEIRVPTLVISGRYDEATPLIAETVHHGIPGSEWDSFENSAHSPHLEETERFLQVLTSFLDRIEHSNKSGGEKREALAFQP
jgi:proline-specific peptidase